MPPACVKVWLNGVPAVAVDVAGFVSVIAGHVESVTSTVPEHPPASVAITVIGKVPPCVGVPERTPAALSVTPAGSVPVKDHVTAPTAPVCVKVTGPYGEPTAPGGIARGETAIVGQTTRSV